ncbi:MAG: CAP domain-containing protein [Thermoleophilia bacterium]|nr:CAP domain-containing protein [Thermoleophilia bacterium]
MTRSPAAIVEVAALAHDVPLEIEGGSLVAPASACPNQGRLDAPVPTQERTMLCMANFARAEVGVAPLEQSAREKARDILRCDSFSHYACGREFAYWIRATGYLSSECWRAGENLAFGSGALGSVRAIFRAWMRSPEHRENILGEYTQTGIDLTTGTLEGFAGTRVWTQHFGTHCEAAA